MEGLRHNRGYIIATEEKDMNNRWKKIILMAGCLTGFLLGAQTAEGKQRYVTYEAYGAVGDGVHDDQAAIVAAHEAANRLGLPVKAGDGKTYFIGKGAQVAVIKTDVDFGTAHFIINDVETENHRQNIFRVESEHEPYPLKGLQTLKRGQTDIGMSLPQESILEVTNDHRRVYIRYGLNQNNGTAAHEVFVADKKGRVRKSTPIIWDYEELTAVTVYPMDRRTLTIKGGTFTTIANQAPSTYDYRARGIQIRRSNVRVEGMTHYVEGELDHGAPYGGFLGVDHAADVTVSHCVFTAHKTYSTIGTAGKPVSMGSYDIGANAAINLRYVHCRQTTDIDDSSYWGLFGSNFCKDLKMDHCVFSRFDAHQGVANVTLTDCRFGYMGVCMVGFGTARIERCEVRSHSLVSLRNDYGSSWDGELIIRHCTVRPMWPYGDLPLINGVNSGLHDFGYLCSLPHRIVIDGLEIDDSLPSQKEEYAGPCLFGTFGRDAHATDLFPFTIEGEASLKGVTVKSGKELSVSRNPDLFKGMTIRTSAR